MQGRKRSPAKTDSLSKRARTTNDAQSTGEISQESEPQNEDIGREETVETHECARGNEVYYESVVSVSGGTSKQTTLVDGNITLRLAPPPPLTSNSFSTKLCLPNLPNLLV